METSEDLIGLLKREAEESALASYSPYSSFPVGAALLTGDGRVFAGCNVENASSGLTICAERVAIHSAVASGARDIQMLVVFTPTTHVVTPCGACRQVLCEFGGNAKVLSFCSSGESREWSIGELLPEAFGAKDF